MKTVEGLRPRKGWLFDLYPSAEGMTIWLVDEDGNKHCCRDRFVPSFYLAQRSLGTANETRT